MPFNLQAALGYAQFLRMDELVGKKDGYSISSKKNLSNVPDITLNQENEDVYNGAWTTSNRFLKKS